MPFVTTTFFSFFFFTMNPSPPGKYKKRNRIMHVFLKFAFMITLNFVYYYLCIIEIECYFILYESTSFHSDIYFMSCKIVSSALPHFENKSLKMIFFFLNNDKRKKTPKKQKEIINNFHKLTYKDWDFFYLAALVFRVPEHVDLQNKHRKEKKTERKKNCRGFYLLSRDTLQQSLTNKHNSSTKALHMAQSTYII